MAEQLVTHIVQVTNIAHNVTGDQIKHFLEYIGRVKEVQIFPEGEVESSQTKVAYARFDSSEHVEVALHLTNTVMIDRALIILPYPDETIPDENKALRVAAPVSTVAGMLPPTKEWPPNVVNMVCGTGSSQTIQTLDAKLMELGMPQYPPLPAKTDPSKIEEIRRTIYVSNLDPGVNAEQLVQFFSQAGEVMFVRMAGDASLPSRNAYVEFTNQRSVPTALAYNGVQLNSRHLKVSHSLNAISSKPQTKGQEQLTREIDEAMKKYKDVEHLIHAAARDGSKGSRKRSRSRSRSRRHKSRERRRSRDRRRSPSPRRSSRRSSKPSSKKEGDKTTSTSSSSEANKERRRRSRTRSRERKRSKSRDKRRSKSREKKRSRSKERKRSHSKERKRSRSKERKRSRSKERKRSRSKERKRSRSKERKRSRSPARKRDRSRDRRSRRSRSRDRRRSRSKDRKSRRRSSSRDRDRQRKTDKSRDDKDSKSDVKVKRDYDAEEKDMEQETKTENGHHEGNKENKDTEESRKMNGDKGSDMSDSESDESIEKENSAKSGKDAMADLEKKVLNANDDSMDNAIDMDTSTDANDMDLSADPNE